MAIQVSNEPDAFRAFELSGWNEVSKDYERVFGQVTAQTADAVLDAAGVSPGCNMLDVCTGHGVLALAASHRGAKVSAIDFAEAMLEQARRNVPTADCRLADAQALPYADNTFDAVVCGYGIMHVPQPDKALAEMLRVLRPTGRAAISVWERPSPANGAGLLISAVQEHGRLDLGLPHAADTFQFGDVQTMKAALTEVGFADVNATSVAQTLLLKRATGLTDTLLQSAVRTKALLARQDEGSRSAIIAAIAQGMDKLFRCPDGFRVPMPAIVGSGVKV
jgi:SAM-dependent methyltransferase